MSEAINANFPNLNLLPTTINEIKKPKIFYLTTAECSHAIYFSDKGGDNKIYFRSNQW
jgi:hypothetical protein